MSRRALFPVLVSVIGHVVFLAYGAPRERVSVATIEQRLSPSVLSVGDKLARRERAAIERRELVTAAREDRDRGKLRLGRFLIEANRIDAEEAGESFDAGEVRARYERRLEKLREALHEEQDILPLAVPRVFGDLRYYGQPGGRMSDALLEGGGSCEQIAHLVVAASFDIGRAKEVSFRFYGRPMPDGATHLAPMAHYEGEDHDLMTGKLAVKGGARVAPEELVEIYARVHGLAPPLAQKGGTGGGGPEKPQAGTDESQRPSRPSLAEGFPPNEDRFPGSLPLYAARAVQHPVDAAEENEDPIAALERARNCAWVVRTASLSPPTIEIEADASFSLSAVSFEPVRSPNPPKLEREAMLLRAAEDLALNPASDEAEKMMSYACLAALGEVAAIDFTLAGETKLANAAVEASKRGREEGKKILASVKWASEAGVQIAKRLSVDYGGRTWLLLFLEGGGEAVLDMTRNSARDDWGRVNGMAALVLFPETRARALGELARWTEREQIDVMHEIFHAHDHLRPWATNYDLELPKDAPASAETFVRVYRVFRGLAFRLWEGHREVGECLDLLSQEARRARLDPAWESAMLDYFARNALGLYAQRPGGFVVVPELLAAARKNGHPSLEPLRKQLEYIQLEGRLDARTLADAFRMR